MFRSKTLLLFKIIQFLWLYKLRSNSEYRYADVFLLEIVFVSFAGSILEFEKQTWVLSSGHRCVIFVRKIIVTEIIAKK